MEERIVITKMHLVVLYALGIILCSWKWNMLGMSEIKALILMMLPACLPFALAKTIPIFIFRHVLMHNLGAMDYKMYQMMSTDSGCTALLEYPNQKEVEKAKRKTEEIFRLHPWMRRYDTRINPILRTGK